MNTVKIEIQYFKACPNSQLMIERVRDAITRLSFKVDYKEILVESPEYAHEIKFRGSPTLLINGIDFENLPEPVEGNLSCRYYPNGLPAIEQIVNEIKRKGTV
jgi:GTP cyclohydrolase FolE2